MIKAKYYVYLLKSTVSNKTYIGYSIDPCQRLKKHNGLLSGGAKKTQKGRPWELVLYITGFEYERTALQYEFCIQRTKKYKRTTGVRNKMYIMKSLLTKQDKICSTAPLTSEMRLVIFFMSREYRLLWESL